MVDILAIVLPIFGLMALGAVAVRVGLLQPSVGDALGSFTFHLALPALLYRTLTTATLPSTIPFGYWGAYFGTVIIVWAVTQIVALKAFRAEPREAVIAGLAGAQANTVMIGIPIILRTWGPEAAVPIALLLGVNLPLTMTIAALLFEAAGKERAPGGMARLVKALLTHPILLAIVAGMATNMAGVTLPGGVATFLDMLGGTAIPCALVGLGMTLVRYGLGGRVPLVAFVTAMKLAVMPALVLVLGRYVFDLPPVYLGAAVVFASAAVGVNVYIVAQRYETGVALASGAILVSTGAAIVSTTVWLWVLGVG